MDRTLIGATIVFAALAIAGTALTTFAAQTGADPSVARALGPGLLAGGLAAFLVEAFGWDRRRTHR
jgi:hypothetical protein